MRYLLFVFIMLSVFFGYKLSCIKTESEYKDEAILSLVQEDSEDAIILREANRLYKERGYRK